MALTYSLPTSNGSRVGEAARDLLGRRIAGDDPANKAKFREMDEATGQAAADMRSTARQTMGRGAVGTGRRNLGTTEQTILEQVAKDKLDQAQAAGASQNSALAAGLSEGSRADSEKFNYLTGAQRNASDMGDSVTQGALASIFLEGGGKGYTPEGQQALAAQTAEQRELDRVAREREDEAYQRMRKNSEPASPWKKFVSGAAGGAMAGASTGSPYVAAGGGLVGGLASLY